MNVPGYLSRLFQLGVNNPAFWRISNPTAAAANEGGVDVPAPGGTPVYALATGTLESSHLFWHNPPNVGTNLGGNPGYGVVSERINVPGYGIEDFYYQHIDINPKLPTCVGGNCGGYVVHKGDLLGWIRSNVGEIELGVNPQGWGPIWGPAQHPGPWVDPGNMIYNLVNADPNFKWGNQVDLSSTPPPGGSGSSSGTGSGTGNCAWWQVILCAPGSTAAAQAPWCQGCTIDSSSSTGVDITNPNTWIKVGLIIFGVVMIIIGMSRAL